MNNRLFLVISSFILTIFLFVGVSTVEGDVSFSLSGITSRSYSNFITSLRNALPNAGKVYNITLLPPSASGANRYLLMKLSNYDDQPITAAVDVINVYIVGYHVNTTSYFFNEPDAQLASQYVFKGTKTVTLPYSGNYERLQNAAGKIRENIPLGFLALDSAITTLFHYDATAAAAALLVIIQTTSEASRYKYIEKQIIERIQRNEVPSLAAISLENEWSAISKQIQFAQTNNGEFKTPVVITDNQGQRVEVKNVSSKVVANNIKLLLNKQNMAPFDNVYGN